MCRHLESGRELYILTSYLRRDGDRLWCEDSTDYCLPVLPGDRLSLVAQTSRGYLMKKNGVTGWYSGRPGGHTRKIDQTVRIGIYVGFSPVTAGGPA